MFCFIFTWNIYEAGLSFKADPKMPSTSVHSIEKKKDTPSVSPAALYFSIARKSCKQREYDVRRISKFFKLMEETLKYIMYKVIQTTYISLFSFHFFSQLCYTIVSDYRYVGGLSIRNWYRLKINTLSYCKFWIYGVGVYTKFATWQMILYLNLPSKFKLYNIWQPLFALQCNDLADNI